MTGIAGGANAEGVELPNAEVSEEETMSGETTGQVVLLQRGRVKLLGSTARLQTPRGMESGNKSKTTLSFASTLQPGPSRHTKEGEIVAMERKLKLAQAALYSPQILYLH
jgi:hypothetical protein